ncbi:phage tail protein, partial [Escherichia coli]|nr:phage tail protein [Escherichia coli]
MNRRAKQMLKTNSLRKGMIHGCR